MSQRTWFITGISSGFGRQLTDQLLRRGDRVVGTVRDKGKITDLLERYPEAFHAEVLDMTDTAGSARLSIARSPGQVASTSSSATPAMAFSARRRSSPTSRSNTLSRPT